MENLWEQAWLKFHWRGGILLVVVENDYFRDNLPFACCWKNSTTFMMSGQQKDSVLPHLPGEDQAKQALTSLHVSLDFGWQVCYALQSQCCDPWPRACLSSDVCRISYCRGGIRVAYSSSTFKKYCSQELEKEMRRNIRSCLNSKV